jgi:hypothetical protein
MLISVLKAQVAASVRCRFGLQRCNASDDCGVENYIFLIHCNYTKTAVEF